MSKLHISEIFSSIQGEGTLAGLRQIFIRFNRCNLDCLYCDTDYFNESFCSIESFCGSNNYSKIPAPVELDDLLKLFKNWTSNRSLHHSFSITGGEPLLFHKELEVLLPKLVEIMPVHLETNGTLPEELKNIAKYLAFVSMDFKLPSTTSIKSDLWQVHSKFLQVAYESGVNVSVKIVVGESTSDEEILKSVDIIKSVNEEIYLFIQPVMKSDAVVITASKLLKLQEIASTNLKNVKVIPQMHKLLGVL